jgi:hypothetical protein
VNPQTARWRSCDARARRPGGRHWSRRGAQRDDCGKNGETRQRLARPLPPGCRVRRQRLPPSIQ